MARYNLKDERYAATQEHSYPEKHMQTTPLALVAPETCARLAVQVGSAGWQSRAPTHARAARVLSGCSWPREIAFTAACCANSTILQTAKSTLVAVAAATTTAATVNPLPLPVVSLSRPLFVVSPLSPEAQQPAAPVRASALPLVYSRCVRSLSPAYPAPVTKARISRHENLETKKTAALAPAAPSSISG